MRIAEGIGGMKASESWSDQVIGTRAERRKQLFLSTNRRTGAIMPVDKNVFAKPRGASQAAAVTVNSGD